MSKPATHLTIGQTFSTPFEDGCTVVSVPDEFGMFDALDSDGVVCGYVVDMVTSC